MKVSFVNKVKFHIKKLYRKAKLPGDDSSQKMPSCTCLKASYTLEAAVIFPLVAGFFVFILFFFICTKKNNIMIWLTFIN